MPTRQQTIARRIAQIKSALAALGPLRPGHLSQQYNICGTPGCRCKADPPQKHGPYYQVSYTWQSKSRSEFVRPDQLPAVQAQLRAYERLRALVEEWIGLGLERARLERASTPASRSKRAHKPPRSPRTRA